MTVCYFCMQEFSFFRKEYGCNNCHKCCCYACLASADQMKQAAPTLSQLKHVCLRCIRQSRLSPDPTNEPPKSLVKMQDRLSQVSSNANDNRDLEKRVQELKNYQKSLPTSSTPKAKPQTNDDIKKRIENLKPKQEEIPTTEDLIRRLAVLKGQDNPPKVEGNNSKTLGSLYPQLTRTDDDDVHDISQGQGHQTSNQGRQGHQGRPGNNDLQDQPSFKSQKSSAEQPGDFQLGDIDFKCPPKSEEQQIDDIIKATLAEVKLNRDKSIENCDGDELEFRIKKQILEERALDESLGEKLEKELKEDGQNVQWCCICNEDAVWLCAKCEDDLYCESCFRRGHTSKEYKKHNPTSLEKK